ncbi:MAG: galactokinase [Deltaproteobacteria bacterium]|nr:galactokinase [Deltaproteobacteria bacterium]MBI3391140.1 galactokinase [Deltaproteobacteria bacterium]
MTATIDPDDGRIARLLTSFRNHFGRPPTHLVRAPGRVNLLGEHTDYNGLPVLPMAIDHAVMIAAAANADTAVRLRNLDETYPARNYHLASTIAPFAGGDWGNYHKAATQGLYATRHGTLRQGGDFLVDGNIPAGAGLSSSSALVVASALAVLALNDIEIPFAELAELLPHAERYVGTLSGGMDQCISLLAVADHALRIDFFPLRVRPVPLPSGYRVVVCHSLVTAEKSGAARLAYNLRVVECRLAVRACEVALAPALPRALRTLGDLANLFPGRSLPELLPAVDARLPPRPLTLAEIARVVGASPMQLRDECHIPGEIGDRFTVLPRLRHVLTEAERVNRAERILASGDAPAFGALMDASHASCRDDYEISCPEIEELVATAKESGAVGARVTGAGFGGCIVALVNASAVNSFLELIDRRFYRPRLGNGARTVGHRFVFQPCAGATVRRLGA